MIETLGEVRKRPSLRRTTRVAGTFLALWASACGGGTKHENVRVDGWAVTQRATVMTNDWVAHKHESSIPKAATIRNIDSYSEKTGTTCWAYDEDFNCTVKTDNYDTFYDYDKLEPVVVRECEVDPNFREYESKEVQADKTCWHPIKDGQWLIQDDPQHIVRVVLSNKKGEYKCPVNVDGIDETLYHKTGEQRTGLIAFESDPCQIYDMKYAPTE